MALPGYEQKAQDVYTKSDVLKTQHGDVSLQRVVLLGKYVMPTETQVVDYLKQIANNVSGVKGLVLPPGIEMGRSPLEQMVFKLPDDVFQHIRTGNEGCLKFIRSNTSALPDGVGARSYVQIQSGLLPPEVIPQIEKDGRKGYESAFHHSQIQKMGLGMKWSGKVLLYDGVLLGYNEMDVLLKHVVRSSETLSITGMASPKDVTVLVQGLYEVEKQDPLFSRMVDLSSEMREMCALEPIVALQEMIQQNQMNAALEQRLGGPNGSRLVTGVLGNGAGSPLVMPGNGKR